MTDKLHECIEKLTSVINATQYSGRLWQMDEEHEVLCTYRSAQEASVVTGVKVDNINTAIRLEHKAGGFYWLRNKDLVM